MHDGKSTVIFHQRIQWPKQGTRGGRNGAATRWGRKTNNNSVQPVNNLYTFRYAGMCVCVCVRVRVCV